MYRHTGESPAKGHHRDDEDTGAFLQGGDAGTVQAGEGSEDSYQCVWSKVDTAQLSSAVATNGTRGNKKFYLNTR